MITGATWCFTVTSGERVKQMPSVPTTPQRRAGASDAELESLIHEVWLGRDDHYSEQRATLRAQESGQHKVEMNYIGG